MEEEEVEEVGFEEGRFGKVKISGHLQITAANKTHVHGCAGPFIM